jgi:hypothetical protein
MTIPTSALLPQDMVDMLDQSTGEVLRMHATDARHAMNVEPDRYVLAAAYAGAPEPEPEPEPIITQEEADKAEHWSERQSRKSRKGDDE